MAKHAELSPSSAHRWGGTNGCTASVMAQRGIANTNSDASRYGTCGHQMSAEILTGHTDHLQSYLDREMWWDDEGYEYFAEEWPHGQMEPAEKTEVDQELIEACWTHVEFVREQALLTGADLYVEERVPIDHITGEQGAGGTSDTLLISGDTLTCIDLKLGRVQVDASHVVQPAGSDIITGAFVPEVVEPNEQLAMYASGAIEKFALFYDIKFVVLVISQPFLQHISQWSGTVEELNKTIDRLRQKARICLTAPTFNPSAESCFYCRASGTCEAQTKKVMETALEGFEDVETVKVKPINDIHLGTLYSHIALLKAWSKAVEARVHEKLLAGIPVVRSDGLAYKHVEGRKGRRAWTHVDDVVGLLQSANVPEDRIYERKVATPSTIETLTKRKRAGKGEKMLPAVLNADAWQSLQRLIHQSDGRPVIAIETDPRPAVSTTDGFEDVPTADDDINGDLF